MRLATLSLLCLVLVGCKKRAEASLPRIPDSYITAGGGVQETPESTVFHTIYKYPGHADQAFGFYSAEMEKRGAKRVGDAYVDDNLVSSGVEHDGVIRAMFGNPIDHGRRQIAVYIENRQPAAGEQVLVDEIQEQRGFAGAR